MSAEITCTANPHRARQTHFRNPQAPLPTRSSFAGDGGVLPAAVSPAASPGGAITSPGGTSYVNLRAYQAGTAAGRDLGQYNFFARRAIERREREEERRRSTGEGGG